MDAKDVAQFLRSNPQFFDQNPQLLESIYVPHPHGGRAIPLTERQIVSLREKIRLLEGKLGEFVRSGDATLRQTRAADRARSERDEPRVHGLNEPASLVVR